MGEYLDLKITQLEGLNLRQLRICWSSHLNDELPSCRSIDTLRRILACKLQEKSYGGLSPDTRNQLRKIARSFSQNTDHKLLAGHRLKPGTVLTREWKGVSHQVRVLEDGFEYNATLFASLSEVARWITGTRWSDPLFFGLKK